MSSQSSYFYLVSTLPPLEMEMPMPIPLSTIMDTCRTFLSPKEMRALEDLTLLSRPSPEYPASINKYLEWETVVRNRLVFLRGFKRNIDPESYKRPEGGEVFPLVEDTIHEIFNLPTYDKEKRLDSSRFRVLDFFTASEQFSFSNLCVYKLKCEIVAKWEVRQVEEGNKNLATLVDEVTQKIPSLAELSQIQSSITTP